MFAQTVSDTIEIVDVSEKYAERTWELIDQQRSYLSEWLPWVDEVQSIEDCLHNIFYCQNQWAARQSWNGIILEKGIMVGRIGFHALDSRNKITSLGYWLSSESQGKGIMRMCVKALVDTVLLDQDYNRVEIRAAVKNLKSQAIPEKLGFKLEGILKEAEWLNDRFVDLHLYAMTKGEWESIQTP